MRIRYLLDGLHVPGARLRCEKRSQGDHYFTLNDEPVRFQGIDRVLLARPAGAYKLGVTTLRFVRTS